MSLYQDIRGALQSALSAVSGIPAIAWEGVPYTPTPGTPFIEPVFAPTAGRPATMGSNHLIRHEGLFLVTLVYPSSNGGTGTMEAMADTIKAAFNVSTPLTLNSRAVRIAYSERDQVILDSDWMRLLVRIGWYTYDTDY